MDTRTGVSLGQRFSSQPNALNFVRLCLALEVILWHSYALRAGTWLPAALERFVQDVAVDGFFAISGFLICRAWTRRPNAGAYLRARATRILPGLWVCVTLTAVVLVPLASGPVSRGGQWAYIWRSGTFWAQSSTIDGTPHGLLAASWNGSLWSLRYEVLCYLLVLVLGMTRRLTRPMLLGLAGFAWTWALFLQVDGMEAYSLQWFFIVPRCLLMFTIGGLLWLFADRVPVSGRLAWGAATVLAASVALPDYRLIGAPALAYLCVVGGLWLGRRPALVLRNDLSYGVYIYAFPIQQTLLLAGLGGIGWAGFSVLSLTSTLPVAAVSWFTVERWGLLRRRDLREDQAVSGSVRGPEGAGPVEGADAPPVTTGPVQLVVPASRP